MNVIARLEYELAYYDSTVHRFNHDTPLARDETTNHIIRECSKLAQKEYKTRPKFVGEVIHWELCQKLKSDLSTKWHLHNPECVMGNKTFKLLRDLDIQTDQQILVRRTELLIVNKQKGIVDFAVLAGLRENLKESEKKYLDLAEGNEKIVEHESDSDTLGIVTKGLVQGQLDLEIKGRIETYPNYSIVEINQNTEKSPVELRRLNVTQTPVRNHTLTLVWKTLKRVKNDNNMIDIKF